MGINQSQDFIHQNEILHSTPPSKFSNNCSSCTYKKIIDKIFNWVYALPFTPTNPVINATTSKVLNRAEKKDTSCFFFFNFNILFVLNMIILLSSCGTSDGVDVGDEISNSNIPSPQVAFQSLGFSIVDENEWDDTAVRKIIDAFAYGGHASDAQITVWANMTPKQAIGEILSFEEHNLLLSPSVISDNDKIDTRDGTLSGLGQFWSSDDPLNGVYEEHRARYSTDKEIDRIWNKAAISHGLNPFRQKVGLWETNYHMATNLDTGAVKPWQIIRYYDDIMDALEANQPYEDILSIGATSAAVAMQFGHRFNKYKDDMCFCNEDFAREYYQLYFGVLGNYDTDYHETVTIKNTAAALTDMSPEWDLTLNDYGSVINFGTEFHYSDTLEIINTQNWGGDALSRISQLSKVVINHEESLENLPIMIISGLADDNLDAAASAQIRTAWANMQTKNLLVFLRAYAVSTLFHNENRIKYLSSIDRYIMIANKMTLNNEEGYLDLYGANGYKADGVQVFRPVHNVFGGQTGAEASNSADVFHRHHDRVTVSGLYRATNGSKYGRTWEKDWYKEAPRNTDGFYDVQTVAEWLWVRFIGDGLKNFGLLERANVYALLATDWDLVYLTSPDDLDRVITTIDLQTDPTYIELLDNLINKTLSLDSNDSNLRREANERIGQAINFIVGTPYIFAQEGR